MSDPYDPYKPQTPEPSADADSFRIPESEFRVIEPDPYRAPEAPADPLLAGEPAPMSALSAPLAVTPPESMSSLDGTTVANRIAEEVVAWLKTLASAAVYATLIVTFGFQVARVEGQSMAPTR